MIGAILADRGARAAFAAIMRRQADEVLANWSEDAVFELPGQSAVSGRYEGKPAIRTWFQTWFERMAEISYTIRHVSVERALALGPSNTVHVQWELDERDQQGQAFHLDGITAIEIERGKVVRVRDYLFDPGILGEIWPAPLAGRWHS